MESLLPRDGLKINEEIVSLGHIKPPHSPQQNIYNYPICPITQIIWTKSESSLMFFYCDFKFRACVALIMKQEWHKVGTNGDVSMKKFSKTKKFNIFRREGMPTAATVTFVKLWFPDLGLQHSAFKCSPGLAKPDLSQKVHKIAQIYAISGQFLHFSFWYTVRLKAH